MRSAWLLALVFAAGSRLCSQQISDTAYHPRIHKPIYEEAGGPVVFIDRGHNNFHTKIDRYKPFANLLEKDGYVVREYSGMLEENKLADGKILVIANALNDINLENWYLPTPSAFTGGEIEALKKWVNAGGSLLLIADHMPFAGAAMRLASVFGFEFSNGFALDTISRGFSYFRMEDSTLAPSVVTRGRDSSERVHQVVTFTGQAFKPPADAIQVLVFDANYTNFLPDTAWRFDANTRSFNVKGWSQGAFKKFGKGKVAVFGEAAMFTAQLAGPGKQRVGMNAETAGENYRLLLNVMHWLDGKLE